MLESSPELTPASARPRPGASGGTRPNRTAANLSPTDILVGLDASTKEAVLRKIARAVGANHGLNDKDVYESLAARERIGSTALGQGVAIPRARVNGIVRPIVAFVRMRFPVSFDAPDGKPVSDMLVLLVPQQATDEHLTLLAQGAEMFCDDLFRESLRTCADADDVEAAFARWLHN